MVEKNISQEFRLTNIDERRNYFFEETEQKDNYEAQKSLCNFKSYWTLSYLVSVVTECIKTSPFASLLGIPIGLTSSSIGLKACAIAARIKK